MPYQLGLPNALTRFGLRVEVIDGWGTRGSSSFNPRGSVSHWTANGSSRDRPSLGVCINGRPGLPGPLCNVFTARSGVAVVVAAGRANHAGVGGWRGLSGNSSVFGTEVEGSIGGTFGTDFTQAQLDAYPRVVAAYHWLMQNDPLLWACGHSEWTTRKIDVGSYAPTLRRQAADLLTKSTTNPQTQTAPPPVPEDDPMYYLVYCGETPDKGTRVGLFDGSRITYVHSPASLGDAKTNNFARHAKGIIWVTREDWNSRADVKIA